MNWSPKDAQYESPPKRSALSWILPLVLGAATGLGFRLVYWDDPTGAFEVMSASFTLLVPVVVGAVTIYFAERSYPRKQSFHFFAAAGANALFVLGTFLLLIEGLICTILAVPLFAIIGGVAGLVTGAVCRLFGRPNPTILSVVVLPLFFGSIEQHIPLPSQVDTVTTVRLIRASPARVWEAISHASDIRPEEMDRGWMYRIGVPLPLSAITETRDGERIRHIEMDKGIAFDQIVVDWESERRVRYTYRFTADSFPPNALDDHVRIGGDYFDLRDTEYRLEPTIDGTKVTARISYRVSTHFNWYARTVARLLVGNFEQTALTFYARRAEAVEPAVR